MLIRVSLALPLVGLLIFAGCRDQKIRTYKIAKEVAPPASNPMPAGAAGMSAASAAKPPAIHWQKPDAWQEQTGKTMRVGSFLIAEKDGVKTELAITTFPGDVGGDFANVNRWRGQIQLPPINESELSSAITSIDLPAGKFQLIDVTSTEPLLEGKKARILGAWLKQPDRTWFFKITGDADTVGQQREPLIAFLKTVEFAAPEALTQPASTNNLPAPTVADLPPPPPTDNTLTWSAPTSWKPKALGQMRKGSYSVPGDGGEADLSVTMLAAAANPLLENVNRWRRQIGLPPVSEAELPAQTTKLAANDLQFTVIDYTNNGTHVVGAIVYRGEEAWFFKLNGPDAVVASQKPAFIEFLKTVKAR
ncbi:MAG: hypothetical protein QM790_08590 [Nibricoccus sp.]